MRMASACRRTLAVGAFVALALAPACVWAAPASPGGADKAANPVDKVRKDLDKPVSIKIERQPLNAAVDMLKEKSKINIILDSLTIQQQLGFDPSQPPTPVEVDLKDVKVRSALRTILSPYGLTFAVIGETVLITTDDVAMYRQMRQRVNVDLDKVEFGAALKQLGQETATNMILDSRVEKEAREAKVSMNLEDVPLETAVRLLSEMAGLKPVRVGNVLFVTSKQNAGELRNDPDLVQPNPNVPVQPNPPPVFVPPPIPPVAVPPVAVPPIPVPVPDDKPGKDDKDAEKPKADPPKSDVKPPPEKTDPENKGDK